MAEGALLSVAQGIIGALGPRVLNEIGQPWGIKQQLRELRETMSSMEAVLRDAEEQQAKSHQALDWVAKLEDTIYKAVDLVDTINTEALQRKVRFGGKRAKKVRIFFSSSNQLAFRLKLSMRLKELRDTLIKIRENRSLYLNMDRTRYAEYPIRKINRETHSLVHEEDIIGRDHDKMKILQLLVDSDFGEDLTILPIVGLGGLGKTTVAQCVFNDPKVEEVFELKLWVCVSDVFDLKEIVKKIIKSESSDDLDKLKDRLRDMLHGKRYLLVLDDIWNEEREKWNSLEVLLRGTGANGSRVLVTTRSELVANITRTIEPYKLRGLDEEQSWFLFKRMAFEKGKVPEESKIVEIKEEVVEKCRGVPLVLRTIGRLFQSKLSYDPKDVEKVCLSFKNNELSKIIREENDILKTLKVSYDHLPSPLKHCFAYCRLFPKDYEIEMEQVIHLWIAQGFIKSSDENLSDLEDIGYEYFMNLVWGSFLEQPFKGNWGKIKFKIHDFMHDLAILVAGTNGVVIEPDMKNFDDKIRNVSFTFHSIYSWKISLLSLERNKTIRTLLSSNEEVWAHYRDGLYDTGICDVILSNFKFLRALSLYNIGIKKLPNTIRKLKHLRYLDLSQNYELEMLPNSITRLQNLQILNLDGCGALKILPQDIEKLVNLRHLVLGEGRLSLTHMPCGLGKLTSLHTLDQFVLREYSTRSRHIARLGELSNLNSLRRSLTIHLNHGKEVAVESSDAQLNKKQHLQKLCLLWNVEEDDGTGEIIDNDEMSLDGLQPHGNLESLEIYNYMGVRFSNWFSLLTNLVSLQLYYCDKAQQIPLLDQLPSLEVLGLFGFDALEYISDELSASSTTLFFPSLRRLSISGCPNLKGWWRERHDAVDMMLQPSFLRLSDLQIRNCPNLTSMPFFPNLEKLSLQKCSSKPLQQTLMMAARSSTSAASSSSFSTSSPLSTLKSLEIISINESKDIEFLTKRIGSLSSLHTLTICGCPNLSSLQNSSFQSLQVKSCYEHQNWR